MLYFIFVFNKILATFCLENLIFGSVALIRGLINRLGLPVKGFDTLIKGENSSLMHFASGWPSKASRSL